MTENLFSGAPVAKFSERAICPKRELGAYEALWARKGASFKSIADILTQHKGAMPSDFVSETDIETFSRLAIGAIRDASIKRFGVRIHGTREYPERLRDADHPVGLLYFQGLWDLVNTRCVSVVGAREPSEDGKRRAAKLVRLLVADGFTVVSGSARGIDTAAHRAAIADGGHTVAVLGTPITESYPTENRELQRQIADRHLVISQVPIVRYSRRDSRANSHFFPERNVTMAALSEATVIVEAGATSGTLVQARHALNQGRKLFILESCFRAPELIWPAKFTQQGAIRVSNYDEIREHLATRDILKPVGD